MDASESIILVPCCASCSRCIGKFDRLLCLSDTVALRVLVICVYDGYRRYVRFAVCRVLVLCAVCDMQVAQKHGRRTQRSKKREKCLRRQ